MIYQLHAKLLVHRPIHAFNVHQDWRLCGMLRPALGKGTSNPTHPGIFWDNDGDVQSPPNRIVSSFHYHSQKVSQDP